MRMLLLCILLSACAPEIVYKPVPVDVPVTAECHTKPVSVPIWPTSTITPDDSLFVQIRALAATNEMRKAYEIQLSAAAKGCQ